MNDHSKVDGLRLTDIAFDVGNKKVNALLSLAVDQHEKKFSPWDRPPEAKMLEYTDSLVHSARDLNERMTRIRLAYIGVDDGYQKYVEPYTSKLVASKNRNPQLLNGELKIIDEACAKSDLLVIGENLERSRPPVSARENIVSLQEDSIKVSEQLGEATVLVGLAKIAHEFATGNPEECDDVSTMRVVNTTVRIMLSEMMNQERAEHIPYTEYATRWVEEMENQADLEREVNRAIKDGSKEQPMQNYTTFELGEVLLEDLFELQTMATDPRHFTPDLEFGFVQLEAVGDLQQRFAEIVALGRSDIPNAALILQYAYKMHKSIAKWHNMRQLSSSKHSG